jgi:hypothetical protein
MQIQVVSTLTADDEDRVAEALIAWLADLLGSLPIGYALRIDTANATVFRRTNIEGPDDQLAEVGRNSNRRLR